MSTKYFKTPFAENGDREPVPDNSVGSAVNYNDGYTPEYELNPDTDPSGNYVGRQKFNQLLNDVTANIKFIQENGVPEIYADDGAGSPVAYAKGFVGSLGGVVYRALVATDTAPPSVQWEEYDLIALLDLKLDANKVVQAAGSSATNVMSQKAVSDLIGGIAETRDTLSKVDADSPSLKKTSGNTISIKAGTKVIVSGAAVEFVSETPVTMPVSLSAGENYGVWVKPDGDAVAKEAPKGSGPYNWGTAPVADAVMIGGFHYSLTSPGTTVATGTFSSSGFTNQGGNFEWKQSDVDKIAGINEFSIWDLTFRPSKKLLKGMAFDPETKVWVGIYFCGTSHNADGPSRAGSDIASGTVLPVIPLAYGGNGTLKYGRCSWYESKEIAQSHGCRLLEYAEFASAAFGVTEGISLGGASSTPPLTLRQPGYTSRIGLEQATGHVYCRANSSHGSGGSHWGAGPNRGNSYGNPYAGLFGGHRTRGAHSGSRSAAWSGVSWNSHWYTGFRVACDHFNPFS